jgi:Carboxypeptidase regulatory-like domain
MRSISIAPILLFLATLLCYAKSGKQTLSLGRISGIVLNEDGQPVTHASVCVSLAGSSMTECRVQTNETGQFEIEHMSMGTFHVFATKDEDGYSGENQRGLKVVLSTQDPGANITIKLDPKAGMLVGTVRDSLTAKPVHEIQVAYVSTEGKGNGSAGTYNGEFRVNVPTTSDYIIVVSAPGYKSWIYIDPTDQSPSLRLASREQKSLDIELVPKPTTVGK